MLHFVILSSFAFAPPDAESAATPGAERRISAAVTEERAACFRESEDEETEIAPSILHVDEARVILTWVTSGASIGRARISGGANPIIAEEAAATRHHRLELQGLAPGRRYTYEIDGRFTGSFETPSPDRPFRFVVFGHPGGTAPPGEYPTAALASRLLDVRPDFGLCTGDLCYFSNEASFENRYFDIFEPFLVSRPIYVAPGNHEAGFPTSEGIGYEVFRSLFPYDFPMDGAGYHSFVRGNIEFFAFAYGPQTKDGFTAQIEWLRSGLAASEAEFRIVYLGGAQNPMGFDREVFFRTVREGGADLVFGGDGDGNHVSRVDGVDFFFAGSHGPRPREFFMVDATKYRLEISRLDATLNGVLGTWAFETQRQKVEVFDASPLARPGRTSHSALFGPMSIPSDRFDGFRVEVHNPFDKSIFIWPQWAPERLVRPSGDYHYREPVKKVAAGATKAFHFALPDVLPATGEKWVLGELCIRFRAVPADAVFNPVDLIRNLGVFAEPARATGGR